MSSTHRCRTCHRTFRTALGLGVHQARSEACRDAEAKRRRARERERRYRERDPERRRLQTRDALRRLRERQPDYFRTWRHSHPETEGTRRRRWRLANPVARREQQRRRRERKQTPNVPLPPSHSRHPLFEQAWEVLHRLGIRRDDHLVVIHDPRWEDACSEAVLALLEGRDPAEAARRVLADARALARREAPLLDVDRLAG